MNKMKKVLWAVDAFAQDKKLQFATFKALAKLTESSEATIEPVCVLSPDQLKVPSQAFEGTGKEYKLEAEARLERWVKELKNPRLGKPTLLFQKKYSINQTASTLLNYARENKVDLIGIGTHGRTAVERFFIGSFAETIVLQSTVPVFIVNAKSPATKKISKILFPTDFSAVSREAYGRVIDLAATLGAKVTLYYKFEYLNEYTLEGMSLSKEYVRYFEQDKEHRRKMADEWAAEGKKAGVKVEVRLDDKGVYVAEGVLKAAKAGKHQLIALASHSGSVAAAMVGSVARYVIRRSILPVWVIHPERQ